MLTLTRWAFTPQATFGTLECEGLKLFTLEPQWVQAFDGQFGGEPFQSCVPLGKYTLIRNDSDDFPDSWALFNRALGISHEDIRPRVPRFACLIHHGNWRHNSVGCILPGSTISHIQGELGVTNSKRSLARLDTILRRTDEPKLLIRSGGLGAVPS